MDPFSRNLQEMRQDFAAIRQKMNQDYADNRQDSADTTPIVHSALRSESTKLLPTTPTIDKFDPSSSSIDVSSDSKLLLLPSPAPNIDKSNHTSSSDIMSSDSKLLLMPSPAPNIDKSNHTSSSDMSSDSKLLLLLSPAPNIVQSDDPSSSSDLSSDSKLLPSPAPNITTSDPSYFSDALSAFTLCLPPSLFFEVDTIFPYWEYWEDTLLDSFDLLSYNAASCLQGILVSILNQLKCIMFLDGPAPCTHHLHRISFDDSLFSSSFFFNVFTTFRRLGDISIMHDA
jgi:hypothetical protein